MKKKLKIGDRVSYNVVDRNSAYNVEGRVVRVHKSGMVDVETGGHLDRYVHPRMIEFGTSHPVGVIHLHHRKKLRGVS